MEIPSIILLSKQNLSKRGDFQSLKLAVIVCVFNRLFC